MDGLAGGEKIGIAEGVEVAATDGEPAKAAVQRGEFVEIEREHEHAIREAVHPRGEPVVHDAAFVEAGVHWGNYGWSGGRDAVYRETQSGRLRRAAGRNWRSDRVGERGPWIAPEQDAGGVDGGE